MFGFVVNLILMIFSFSLVFFIMSYLNIQMNVELTFKPIYKPLFSELLAISLAISDIRNNLYDYYLGRISEGVIKMSLEKVVKGKYLVCIENKCIGDAKIRGEESILPMIVENKRLNVKVVVA